MFSSLSQKRYVGRKTFHSLLIVFTFFTMALQSAYADNTLTLEASTTKPGDGGPEYIYTLHNNQNPSIYWKEDLTPTHGKSDWGSFTFYQVEGKDNAYYIYDCSMGQWLTYDVKDDYGTATKGAGKKSYIKLSETQNTQAFFVATQINGGYEFQLVNTQGVVTSTPWYLNYYGGFNGNENNTVGIWWHDGGKDQGSLWFLSTPPSSADIKTSTTEPSEAGDDRLDNVFTLHNGYGAGVDFTMTPSATEDGHFVFYHVPNVENAFYIYDYSLGKWLDYDKRESYNPNNEQMHGEKDFIKLSDNKDNYFYITDCETRGIKGYQIQPYTTSGEVSDVYLNYYLGSDYNKTNTLGFYTHDGNKDTGSLWKLDATDPHAKTISELDTQDQYSYLCDVNVTLTRSLKSGCWNTFCVPFNVSESNLESVFGSGYKLREFTSMDEDGKTLKFTEATQIEAGKPYLLNPAQDVTNPTFKNIVLSDKKAQTVEHEGYSMVGTYGTATLAIDGTDLFVTADNRFKKPMDAQSNHNLLKGLRAYFIVPTGTNSDALRVFIADNATAIDTIHRDATQQDAPVYDLQGQCVGTSLEGLSRGVYIKNHKKIVVK